MINRADITQKSAQSIHQYLGKYVYIEYSCHTQQGVIVALGTDWALFDNGAMLWTPAISKITTTIPKKEVRSRKGIPMDLNALFD